MTRCPEDAKKARRAARQRERRAQKRLLDARTAAGTGSADALDEILTTDTRRKPKAAQRRKNEGFRNAGQ